MKPILFEESGYYTGPDLTDVMVEEAEQFLGYSLPRSYVNLLRLRNGGTPRDRCFMTEFPTSWAPDHIEIAGIRGVGGVWGIQTEGPLSSRAMIGEWGYPDIGIVVCDMPSGGHDAVMLDYSRPGQEPAVTYIDEDRAPRVIAGTFEAFVDGLVKCRNEVASGA